MARFHEQLGAKASPDFRPRHGVFSSDLDVTPVLEVRIKPSPGSHRRRGQVCPHERPRAQGPSRLRLHPELTQLSTSPEIAPKWVSRFVAQKRKWRSFAAKCRARGSGRFPSAATGALGRFRGASISTRRPSAPPPCPKAWPEVGLEASCLCPETPQGFIAAEALEAGRSV